ncbi:hypothetical protein CPC08DRAFT_716928 [Agrocybe pediades]|nr:hypothetical protein CPC08DRAFT_716928 [Agrocybe pediades]
MYIKVLMEISGPQQRSRVGIERSNCMACYSAGYKEKTKPVSQVHERLEDVQIPPFAESVWAAFCVLDTTMPAASYVLPNTTPRVLPANRSRVTIKCTSVTTRGERRVDTVGQSSWK